MNTDGSSGVPGSPVSGAASPPRTPLRREDSNLPVPLGPSPSQTLGPYFHQGLTPGFQGLAGLLSGEMVLPEDRVEGERITLTGRVLDADGVSVEDALVEVWQADAGGRFTSDPQAGFSGYGRADTRGPGHRFTFHTVKPGAAGPGLAPRLNVWLGMRGLLTHLITAVYFSDEDNGADPLLALVPQARQHTLVARREETAAGAVYHLDIHLQGPQETVFFDAY